MSRMAATTRRRSRRQFSDEFRAGAVRLVLEEGKTVGAVARELDLTESALRQWVERARADRSGGRTGLTTAEREELARLRKENRILAEERDILKKGDYILVYTGTVFLRLGARPIRLQVTPLVAWLGTPVEQRLSDLLWCARHVDRLGIRRGGTRWADRLLLHGQDVTTDNLRPSGKERRMTAGHRLLIWCTLLSKWLMDPVSLRPDKHHAIETLVKNLAKHVALKTHGGTLVF